MKFGDPVIFTENGIEYNATCLSSRVLDFHGGTNDEPLMHLGFFKEVPGVIGTARESELFNVRHDVVHESHEFSASAKDAGHKGTFPGGRWREVSPAKVSGMIPWASEVATPVAPALAVPAGGSGWGEVVKYAD